MKWLPLLALSVTVASSAGCSSAHPLELAAPAPADALSCALGASVEAGYEPREGGVADGYVVLLKRRGTTGGEVGKEVAARVLSGGLLGGGKHIDYDALRLVGAGGRLNVLVWSVDSGNGSHDPTEEGKADAQALIERCGAR